MCTYTTPLELSRVRLLHSSGAEPLIFLIGNRVRILQALEFLELIGHTEADHVAKLIARLLGPLVLPFRHPAVLRDQVDEHSQIGEYDQHDHPNHLGPTRHVPSAEQVAKDCDQQPEPQHEDEYREDVGQKVGKSETAWKQHAYPPLSPEYRLLEHFSISSTYSSTCD